MWILILMYLLQEMTANLRRNCREILYIFQFMYKTSFHFEHPPSHLWAKEYNIASNNTKYPHVFLSWKSSEVYLSINYEITQWPLQKVGKGWKRVVLFGGWGWGGWLEFSTPCSWQVFIFPRHVTSSEDIETMISRLYSSKMYCRQIFETGLHTRLINLTNKGGNFETDSHENS